MNRDPCEASPVFRYKGRIGRKTEFENHYRPGDCYVIETPEPPEMYESDILIFNGKEWQILHQHESEEEEQ